MRWSAGHIFAPPPPQLDCAHQAAAAGGWQPWPGPPGAGAVRSEAGTLQIQTLGTGDSRGIVLGKGQSPESCLCGLSAFVIRIHHSGDNALTRSGWRGLAWPGWRDYCIRKKPALGQRERMSLSASCQTCDKTSTSRTHLIRHTAAGASKLLRGAVYDHYHWINANIT